IAFFSRKLKPAETCYPTHDKELLAIVDALKQWRHYLHGAKFRVETDHHSLIWLKDQRTLNHRQIRWLQFLASMDPAITYLQGKQNVVADALSRFGVHTLYSFGYDSTNFEPKEYTDAEFELLKNDQTFYSRKGYIYKS